MRQHLFLIGVLAMVLLISVGMVYEVNESSKKELALESSLYNDITVVSIVKNWKKSTLLWRTTPAFRIKLGGKAGNDIFEKYSRLGKLKKFRGSKGGINIDYTTGGRVITASYDSKAAFANGPADIHLALVKADDQWQVSDFSVTSNVKFENLSSVAPPEAAPVATATPTPVAAPKAKAAPVATKVAAPKAQAAPAAQKAAAPKAAVKK